MSHLSDPDRLERLAVYVLDEPPNATPIEVAEALTDAAERIRLHQALDLVRHLNARSRCSDSAPGQDVAS